MVQRVLVAVDGSKASTTALEVACGLADKYDAALGLITVAEPDEVGDDLIKAAQVEGVIPQNKSYSEAHTYAFGPYTASSTYQELERSGRALRLATLLAEETARRAEAFSSDRPFKAIKTFVSSGDPAKAILKVARENDADIIIMGHDEPKWYKAPFKKSVAKTVVRRAECPVMVYSSQAAA